MIETDINKRWEEGFEHHKKSKELMRVLKDLDFKYGNDFFCFKYGGDGDNGEHLMYLLDIYFEIKDQKMTNKKEQLILDLRNELSKIDMNEITKEDLELFFIITNHSTIQKQLDKAISQRGDR